MIRNLIVFFLAVQIWAVQPRACIGSLPIGTFRLTVQPDSDGSGLPIRAVNVLSAGRKLRYQPVQLPPGTEEKAQVAAVLVPVGANEGELLFLEPHAASKPADWAVPRDISVVALVFGPQGLSVKKVKNLTEKNQDLLAELADYAQQNSQVEALVQTLSNTEESGGSVDAALSGFSSRYNVSMPRLDSKASSDQQAAVLLQALMPTAKTYDP